MTLSSARLLRSACPPGAQALGPASSGHRGSCSAWTGLHIRMSLSPHTLDSRPSLWPHTTDTGHNTSVRTRIHITLHHVHTSHGTTDAQTDVAETGPRGAGVPPGVPRLLLSSSENKACASCSPLSPTPPKPHPDTGVKGQKKPDSSFLGRPEGATRAL